MVTSFSFLRTGVLAAAHRRWARFAAVVLPRRPVRTFPVRVARSVTPFSHISVSSGRRVGP